jgi:hypothetical protein
MLSRFAYSHELGCAVFDGASHYRFPNAVGVYGSGSGKSVALVPVNPLAADTICQRNEPAYYKVTARGAKSYAAVISFPPESALITA